MGSPSDNNINESVKIENSFAFESLILKAKELATKYNTSFVGTEHLLLSLLTTNNQFRTWLEQNASSNLCKDKSCALQNVLEEIIENHKLSDENDSDVAYCCDYKQLGMKDIETSFKQDSTLISPCLSNTIYMVLTLKGSNEVISFIEVLLGIILSHKEFPNPGGLALLYVLSEKKSSSISQIITKLTNLYRPVNIEELTTATFTRYDHFKWSKPIPAAKIAKCFKKRSKTISISLVNEWPDPPVPEKTHWVVPGRILVGCTPANMTQMEILNIVNSGIDTFVCLHECYSEFGLDDYRDTLKNMKTFQNIVVQKLTAVNPLPLKIPMIFPPHKLRFLHCPMRERRSLWDNKLWEFIEVLGSNLKVNHRNLYIHCYGGHHRTGIIVVNLLEYLFGIDKNSAMETLSNSHRKRNCTKDWCIFTRGKLEGPAQEVQAKRLENIMRNRLTDI